MRYLFFAPIKPVYSDAVFVGEHLLVNLPQYFALRATAHHHLAHPSQSIHEVENRHTFAARIISFYFHGLLEFAGGADVGILPRHRHTKLNLASRRLPIAGRTANWILFWRCHLI